MKYSSFRFVLIILAFGTLGCDAEKVDGPGTVRLSVRNLVGQDIIQYQETSVYQNNSNENFSFSKLKYVLSAIKLTGTQQMDSSEQALMVDEVKSTEVMFTLPFCFSSDSDDNDIFDVAVKRKTVFAKIEFVFGLSSDLNASGYLAKNTACSDMEWPTAEEGGYHYLKWEGSYAASRESPDSAYKIHTGPTGSADYSALVSLDTDFTVDGDTWKIVLDTNFQKFFVSPEVISFAGLPSNVVVDTSIQTKIKSNVATMFSVGALSKISSDY